MSTFEKQQAMMHTRREVHIPFVARRFVSRYEPELRAQMLASLRAKMEETSSSSLTWDDLHSAVNDALSAFRPVDGITPDPRMERLALDAHRRGDFQSSKEFIDELRAELAKASEAETAGPQSPSRS